MKYIFTAHGHPNILATHRTTLEITKDSELTTRGNCVVAVAADFSLERIRELIQNCDRIKLTITVAGMKDEITAAPNRSYSSDTELVLRKGDFLSDRTLGTRACKAAADLKRGMIDALKSGNMAATITIDVL